MGPLSAYFWLALQYAWLFSRLVPPVSLAALSLTMNIRRNFVLNSSAVHLQRQP
jgi:hypothetical protein